MRSVWLDTKKILTLELVKCLMPLLSSSNLNRILWQHFYHIFLWSFFSFSHFIFSSTWIAAFLLQHRIIILWKRCGSSWNIRKKIVQNGSINLLGSVELKFFSCCDHKETKFVPQLQLKCSLVKRVLNTLQCKICS